jgi:hypothetical protein
MAPTDPISYPSNFHLPIIHHLLRSTHYSVLTSSTFCHITPFLLSSARNRENAYVSE